MRARLFPAFLLFWLLSPAERAPRAQEVLSAGVLDLSSLVRAAGEEPVFFGPVLGKLGEDEEFLPSDPGVVPPVPPDFLASFLQEALGGQGALSALDDGRFLLSGPAKALERASARAALLQETLGKPITVEGIWFDPGEASLPWTGAILGPEEAEQLWRGLGEGRFGNRMAGFRAGILPGGAFLWRRVTTYVQIKRFEADVASKTKSVYPTPSYPQTGFKVRLRAAPLPGGKAALFLDAWRGSDLELRRVEIGLSRVPWVEAASAGLFLGSASGAVKQGGALLFRVGGEEGNLCLVLRVLDLPLPAEKVVFLGPAFLNWHRSPGLPVPPALESDQEVGWSSTSKEEEVGSPLDPDNFKEFLAGSGMDLRALFPSGALLAGPAWVAASWRAVSAGLHVPPERTCAVEIFVKGMVRSEAAGLTPQEVFQRGRILLDLSFPVLEGRSGVFVAGRESQHVGAYSSNVAMKSAALVPVMKTLFSGFTGRVTVRGDEARVEILQDWTSPPERVVTGAEDNGPLEKVVYRRGGLSGSFPVDGRFQILGEGVGEGSGKEALRVVVGIVLQKQP